MHLKHSRPLTLSPNNETNRKRLIYSEVMNDFFKRTVSPKLNPKQPSHETPTQNLAQHLVQNSTQNPTQKRLIPSEVLANFFKIKPAQKLNPKLDPILNQKQPKINQTFKLETKIDPISLSKEVSVAITKARGNPQNVIDYQYDQDNRLTWLESGNMYITERGEKGSGFWHIENRRYQQFQHKFDPNLTEMQMVKMVMEAVKNGRCEVEYKTNKLGQKVVSGFGYTIDSIFVYVGDNGYLIGAHPTKN